MALTNRDISKIFKLGAALLEVHDENPFKYKAYLKAADEIRALPMALATVPDNELETIPGIGKNLAKKVTQIRETGSYDELDKRVALTPPGLLEMVKIKGLGGKKIHTLWKEAGITSPEELLEACEQNKLLTLKGFGKKTQEQLVELVHFHFESKNKVLYAEAEYEAQKLLEYFESHNLVQKVSLTGEMRRKLPVIEQIDILLQLDEKTNLADVLAEADRFLNIDADSYSTAILDLKLVLHRTTEKNWAETLLRTTGNEKHLEALDIKPGTTHEAFSEEHIYAKNGWPYVIPELREGRNDKEIAENVDLNDIVRYDHIKGCLHNHSTYSDGAGTLEEMARACIDLGLEYFGIADHSQTAFYANGMKPNRVPQQWKEIDKLNEKLAPFRILKGIESDILNDGSLDYDDEILKGFDYVVASIHANQKMTEAEATKRLITAIENPYTTILGHMTGRLLLMRKGYPVDHKKVIDACAANKVVMEVNANPRRLDMDWKWLQYAQQKGVLIAINPDAHSIEEIENMQFGVHMARKGGIAKSMVLNTFTLKEIEEYLKIK